MVPIVIHDLILAIGVFLGLFTFQALLWHFVNVPRQMIVLFGIFLFGPTFFYLAGYLEFPGFFFSMLLSCNYISAFPVLQASSPTIVMLEFLVRKKVATEEEIYKEMLRYGLVEDRLSDLENGALVMKEGDGYRLTAKGDLLASFFIAFRKALALPQGAG